MLQLLEFHWDEFYSLCSLHIMKSYLKPVFLFCKAVSHVHLRVCIIYVCLFRKSEQVPSITLQKYEGTDIGGCINISHINEEITTTYGNSRTD